MKFGITRKILKQTTSFSPVSNRCNLCLWEKYFIICRPELATLNKRNELVTSCRHANKFLLKNFKPTITTRYQLFKSEFRAQATVNIQIQIPTDDIVNLAELVLRNNIFEFDGKHFLQKRGTAIGTRMTPAYANIFMHDLNHSYWTSLQ